MISKVVIMSIGASLGMSAAVAHADTASFVGKWHWDRTRSTVVPGEPPPKDVLLDIADTANGRLKWTLTAVDPEGQSHVESFDGPSNGAPTKVIGDEQTSASFVLASDSLKAVFKGPQGDSDSWSCALSADQRMMTCHGTQSDGQGHSRDYTDVYNRG
jgi:hypothetical protein